MQTAWNHFLSESDSAHDGKASFNVVVAYEDFKTGKTAKHTYDYLIANLGEECEFNNQMWKFDVLSMPKLAAIAVHDACEADIILVATHGGSLPPHVRSWLDSWASRGTRAIALVGLCDGEPAAAHAAYNTLREAANRACIPFFAHPDFWPAVEPALAASLERAGMVRANRGQNTLTALPGVVLPEMHDELPAPRWGLNE